VAAFNSKEKKPKFIIDQNIVQIQDQNLFKLFNTETYMVNLQTWL